MPRLEGGAKPTCSIVATTSIALHRLPKPCALSLVGIAVPLIVPPISAAANIIVVLLVVVSIALLTSITTIALLQGAVLACAVSRWHLQRLLHD